MRSNRLNGANFRKDEKFLKDRALKIYFAGRLSSGITFNYIRRNMNKLYTSESVTVGHPDKVCDQISDKILDEYLKVDENSRVACETCISKNFLLIMGEITSNASVDLKKCALSVLKDIGYGSLSSGFNTGESEIKISISKQSPDIKAGVDSSFDGGDMGAGDQGMVYGYATDETEEFLPFPLVYSHKLTNALKEAREKGIVDFLLPDGKAQVTAEYSNGKVVRVDSVVLSSQHKDTTGIDEIRKVLKKEIIDKVIPQSLVDQNTKYFINPTGRFVVGGPEGDSGMTGRKIIVDTYGGFAPHGGGAFSGKDPSKVDRSAAYMARYVCKNLVKSGICKRCQISVAYAIGVANPVAINIDAFGTAGVSEEKLYKIVNGLFSFRPSDIINTLNLKNPIYYETAKNGHFGKDFPWERTDKVQEILKAAK